MQVQQKAIKLKKTPVKVCFRNKKTGKKVYIPATRLTKEKSISLFEQIGITNKEIKIWHKELENLFFKTENSTQYFRKINKLKGKKRDYAMICTGRIIEKEGKGVGE